MPRHAPRNDPWVHQVVQRVVVAWAGGFGNHQRINGLCHNNRRYRHGNVARVYHVHTHTPACSTVNRAGYSALLWGGRLNGISYRLSLFFSSFRL